MIQSNSNPHMTKEDVCRFRSEMARRMRGERTGKEIERLIHAKKSYDIILKNNGGHNPIFS